MVDAVSMSWMQTETKLCVLHNLWYFQKQLINMNMNANFYNKKSTRMIYMLNTSQSCNKIYSIQSNCSLMSCGQYVSYIKD